MSIARTSCDSTSDDTSTSSTTIYEYKRTIYHFFTNFNLAAVRSWNNVVSDMQVVDGNYYYTYKKHNTKNDNISGSAVISKGFFRAHLKTALTLSGTWGQGEQYTDDRILDFKYHSYSLAPEIIYSPDFMEVSYNGSFNWNQSEVDGAKTNTLFDWTQRLTLTSTIGNIDLTVAGVLYHNELQESSSINTFLADASAVWRLKRVRLRAELRNLFNKKTYAETTYSGVGVFTNNYVLRPREFLFSVQFNLGL